MPSPTSSDLKCLCNNLLLSFQYLRENIRKCNHSFHSIVSSTSTIISYSPTRLTLSSLHIGFVCVAIVCDGNIKERSGPAMDSPPRIVCRSCWTVPPPAHGKVHDKVEVFGGGR